MTTRLTGIAASEGIAVAKAFPLQHEAIEIVEDHNIDVDAELVRLKAAVNRSRADLDALYTSTQERVGSAEAEIFRAHAMILEDPEFVTQIEDRISTTNVNAPWALKQVTEQLTSIFESMTDEYLRERAADIRDVSQRVLGYLQGTKRVSLTDVNEPVVVVAHDLAPSDTVNLDKRFVKAFVTDVGGRTSHSAIMARTLGIPAVVGLQSVSECPAGETVIVDGTEGVVLLDPSDEVVSEYLKRASEYEKYQQELLELVDAPARTQDGHRVELAANIGKAADVTSALENGAEGIGLYRSEFLYMNRDNPPTEEEQFAAYREVVEKMAGKPVIIRTLDVGGDKEIPYLNLPKEANPFLGYRAIRVCLEREDLFKTQLRAILRASHYGPVKVMFPMISTITELRRAKSLLQAAKDDLASENTAYSDAIEVGIMVEIPASAIAADILAKEVDFFSIGTNDLIQYTMACDRMNESISHLYQPYHPSILRLVKMVIDAAHTQHKWVGMCGEMAGDRAAVPLLLGLGLDEFSMSAGSLLSVRKLIRGLTYTAMQDLAAKALVQESQEAVRELVSAHLQ